MKKDLLEYAASEEKPDDEEAAPEGKPALASRKLEWLAEKTGVKDPAALLKLVRAMVEACMEGSASEER